MQNETSRYQQALAYIYEFVDFSLTHQEQVAPERFELERMVHFLEKLDSPHLAYPSIHIAGTKGKGSVAAHCAAALQAGGYKTGLYTSPHLHDFRERIQVDGEMISMRDFTSLVDKLKPAVESTPGLTSYELQTALAFIYFSQQHVDYAVLEVGMGGCLDSTNVITPLVSVVTSISYDHTYVLGDTLSEIAGEKGGIIKPGVPVVSAPQQEEALLVLEKLAEENGSEIALVGREIEYEMGSATLEGQSFMVKHSGNVIALETRLLGQHQVENAVTAFAALDLARSAGLVLDNEAIRTSFKQVNWPGRFEVVHTTPPVVFDCAHNRDSVKRLAQTVNEYFPGRPITLVFGAMEDKDISGMFAELLPQCDNLILTRAVHPRSAKIDTLVELAAGYGTNQVLVDNSEDVLPQALALAGSTGIVLVTGSLSVVGDFRSHWFHKMSEDGYN
jgi:dihydrofolate synthase/folylpolyglutamate synthase